MLKNLAILCVFVVGSSGKPHDPAGNKDAVPNKQPPTPVTTNTYDSNCCSKQTSLKADEEVHHWYLPLQKPDWWLVLVAALTGIAVGSQAWETRKSARAAARQATVANKALISQFRPKIQIRTIKLIETDDSLSLEVIVANKGESEGIVCSGFVNIDWQWSHRVEPTRESKTTYETFTLQPGEDSPLTTNMTDGWLLYRMAVSYADEGRPGALTMRCSGEIHYLDGNGIKRRTAFWRVLDHTSGRFIPDPTPEREYQD